MSDPARHPSSFHWQALLQDAREALFFLNRRRRIVYVNPAWEALTGLNGAAARGRLCQRRGSDGPGWWPMVARAIAPPPEALHGQIVQVRRTLRHPDGRQWAWDIDFIPFPSADSMVGILGRIIPVPALAPPSGTSVLSDTLRTLRIRHGERFPLDTLTSQLPAMRQAAAQARLASQTRAPVLIVGEAGTGKQWLARAIHHASAERERPLAALDCAHLPEFVLAAALFGDNGLLRGGNMGTVYLREPGQLSRHLRTQLMAWLRQPRAASPATAPRLIAGCIAKHADQPPRDELHCALGTLLIALPPLREREADLPDLTEKLVRRLPRAAERPGWVLAPEALEMLRHYSWPGNLRELALVLHQAAARASNERLGVEQLPAYLRQVVVVEQTVPPTSERSLPLKAILEQVERRLIVLALRQCQGNKSKAARWLGIWRETLLRRMTALGIRESEPPQ
ncbi:MAG: sigma 54-interacting transcriptional regulator [Gemmataceae bacterium]